MDQIIDFAELRQFIDAPLRTYSSGMQMRLGFSVAAHADAEIFLVDEALAVGDEEFQEKCFQKFRDFKKAGKTVILVSHAMETVKEMCTDVAWLNKGDLMAVGPAVSTIKKYLGSLPPEARHLS